MSLIFSDNLDFDSTPPKAYVDQDIEVTLDDQGEAWDTKNKPKHNAL